MRRYGGGELGSATSCPGCDGEPCRQSWQFHGCYANDPHGLRWAIARAHAPVATPDERAAALASYERERPEMKRLCEKIKAERNGRLDEFADVKFVPSPFDPDVYPRTDSPLPERKHARTRRTRSSSRT